MPTAVKKAGTTPKAIDFEGDSVSIRWFILLFM
jgi:hypothetical protein